MNKQIILWQSQLFSLQVQMQGLTAENQFWISQGQEPTYRECDFQVVHRQAEQLTEKIMLDKT